MSGDGSNTTSTGHAMSDADWLDVHFIACRPEYLAMLGAAGIQEGWRVLDAGCGSGSFLPFIAGLVGSDGRVDAVDIAPESVARVQERLGGWTLACPVDVQTAGLDALPFPDDTFDLVWCANVTQYFTDEELTTAYAELRRVTRPGGIVAVKDSDASVIHMATPTPFGHRHLLEGGYLHGPAQARGAWRGPTLRRWATAAGLEGVHSEMTLIERHAPYDRAVRQLVADFYRTFVWIASVTPLPEEEAAEWRWIGEHVDEWVADPGQWYREGAVLVTGRVPQG